MDLVVPSAEHLDSYVAALQRGWSPSSAQPERTQQHLAAIDADAAAFLASLDRHAAAGTTTLPDGSTVPRIPGFTHWLWDGDFAGIANLRWQPGTPELPPYVLGHIGYGVVPWRRRRGYATQAVRLLVRAAATEGLPYVEIVVDESNRASQRVALAAGATLVERFTLPAEYDSTPARRFRIPTT